MSFIFSRGPPTPVQSNLVERYIPASVLLGTQNIQQNNNINNINNTPQVLYGNNMLGTNTMQEQQETYSDDNINNAIQPSYSNNVISGTIGTNTMQGQEETYSGEIVPDQSLVTPSLRKKLPHNNEEYSAYHTQFDLCVAKPYEMSLKWADADIMALLHQEKQRRRQQRQQQKRQVSSSLQKPPSTQIIDQALPPPFVPQIMPFNSYKPKENQSKYDIIAQVATIKTPDEFVDFVSKNNKYDDFWKQWKTSAKTNNDEYDYQLTTRDFNFESQNPRDNIIALFSRYPFEFIKAKYIEFIQRNN